MLSLNERIELLEHDLMSDPPRVGVYHDLPFAILRYDPSEEWELRRQVKLLATRLHEHGKNVHCISIAQMLWQVIDSTEGIDALAELESYRGYEDAQDQVTTYLSDKDWMPLSDTLAASLNKLQPSIDIAFIIHVASMGPAIYYMSKLLDEIHGKTLVTTILFYPGTLEGTTGLRFMDLKDREALGNYRVKIYG